MTDLISNPPLMNGDPALIEGATVMNAPLPPEQALDATPPMPGEIEAGAGIISSAAPANAEAPVTVPTPVLAPQIKETFLQKAETDIEEAYHWLVKEIHKICVAL